MIRLDARVQYRDERPSTPAEIVGLLEVYCSGRVLVLHWRAIFAPAIRAVGPAVVRALVDVIQFRVDKAHVTRHHLNQPFRVRAERRLQEEYIRMIRQGGRSEEHTSAL